MGNRNIYRSMNGLNLYGNLVGKYVTYTWRVYMGKVLSFFENVSDCFFLAQ